MKKCLKVTLIGPHIDGQLKESVQSVARKLDVEGTVQFVEPNQMVVIACGSKEKIDAFLDAVHQGFGEYVPEDIQIEPFLKDKDYRGIFRILE